MNDENEQGADIFGDLVQGLEDELNSKTLEKKGAYAIVCARFTGAVYTEAVGSGVPADLAKDMATDSWMGFMGIQPAQIVSMQVADED